MTNTATKSMNKIANDIGDQWGAALTKSYQDGDVGAFRDLFVQDPVEVVLQASDGVEAVFSVADNSESEATLTWKEFYEVTTKDLKDQDFAKTESQCLGVLGDRFIMELARFNQSGEIYMEGYSVVSFNADGKVFGVEAFSDARLTNLTTKVNK